MLARHLIGGALAALLALPGCGGDDSDGAAGPSAPAGTRAGPEADAEAKSNARNLTSYVESCFAETQDYTACDTEAELGATGLTMGPAPGQVQVVGATATGYSIVARSVTGTTFTIARASGLNLERQCSNPGTGGCSAQGTW